MPRPAIILVLIMVAVIVAVDILILRHHFRARLLANVAIVVVFGAIWFTLLRRH
ncbi:MAG: hypothetical protein KGL48_03190 [Sphingomonadales bacterium]|nr:hypothetical protein [Sphingomonadales bacterium]MDE2570229.1 hypothetical protein [Sphingomonadales bacterium]